jgi:hypothetical protein
MSKALNELKKATMASYLAKAGGRIRSGTKIGLDFEHDAYKDMAVVNKHHPNVYNPGFEKDPAKLAAAEKNMNVNFDLAKTFKRDAANRIKGIARAGRRLAKEEAIVEGEKADHRYLPAGPKKKASDSAQTSTERKTALARAKKFAAAKKANEEIVNEAGKNPYGPGYKLVDKDGTELKIGHKFMHTSHHEGSKPEHHEITGWQSGEQRGNSSSSGRVAVRVGKGKKAYDTEYFPHVFDMKVVKEDVEEVNELKTSTLVNVATARYKQAHSALKDKDYGGYVKGMKKWEKAAAATIPKSGWSPEDDKKNEEVAPVVSAQEKYRQIKEARMAKAQKSTTTHHNFYVYHDELDKASKVLKGKGIPHSVADHSSAPVDHSVVSVRHKHFKDAAEALNAKGIDFGGGL